MKYSFADFYPLIGILAVVLVLTALSVFGFGMSFMLAFMGWFFVIFGSLKIVRIHGFVNVYQLYDVLAIRSKAYAYAYPFIELGFGLAYLFAWQVVPVSILVVIVMLISALGVYLKLRENEEIPCACLGTVFKIPMTWVTLGEDLLMAGMAITLII